MVNIHYYTNPIKTRDITRMCKQWVPGHSLGGEWPGDEATGISDTLSMKVLATTSCTRRSTNTRNMPRLHSACSLWTLLRTVKAASSSRKHSKGKKPLGYRTYYLCKTVFLLFLLCMYVFLKYWTWTLITLLPWKLHHPVNKALIKSALTAYFALGGHEIAF